MTELQNTIESFNNRLAQAEDRISELKDKTFELTQSEKKNKNNKKEPNLWETWDHQNL